MASILLKVWTGHLTTALMHVAEHYGILSQAQEGFRKYHSTSRQLRNVVSAIEDAHLFGQNIYSVYVDFSATFNMVDHQRLQEILKMLGIPQQARTCIANLYNNASTTIITPFGHTEAINISRGTLQGDTLSPLLFLLYIEPLLRHLHVGGRGYRFGALTTQENDEMHLAGAAYADDLTAMTRNVEDMQIQCNKITEYCKWARLQVNANKCAVTAGLFQLWKQEQSGNWDKDVRVFHQLSGKIKLLGTPLPALLAGETYTYLGMPLCMTLDWTAAFHHIKQKMDNRISQIFNYAKLHKGYMLQMVDEAIKKLPIYAFAVTPFNHSQLHQVESICARATRRAANLPRYQPTWSVTEGKEYGCLGIGSLYSHMVQTAGRNLIDALNDTGRLGLVTRKLTEAQITTLAGHPCAMANTGWDDQARYAMTVRQLTLLQQAQVDVKIKG